MIGHLGLPRRSGRAFLADARGLAAIELALILPFAAMLMSLVVYGGQAYWVQRKVTLAATTVANIFAQANNTNSSTITAAELNQIFRLSEPDPLSLQRHRRRGRSVAIAGHRQRDGPRPARSAAAGPTPMERRARSTNNCRSTRRSPPLFPARPTMTVPIATAPPIMSYSARCSIRFSRPDSISRSARSPFTTRSS